MEPTVHDRFARHAFAHVDVMRAHLRGFLPAAVLGRLDLDELRREPDTLLGAGLTEKQPDLVFSSPLIDGGGGVALARFLFQHKSAATRDLPFDLWSGAVRLTENWRREHPREDIYPWIIPVVLYAGPRRFSAPRRYAEVGGAIGKDDPAVAIGPDLSYVLNDLTRFDDDELRARSGNAAYQALLHLVLKHAWDDDFHRRLADWADLLTDICRLPTGFEALRSVLSYIWGLERGVTQEDVAAIVLPRLKPAERDDAMTAIKSYADQLRHEGIEKGLEKGLEQGRRSVADQLLRLLRSRFEVDDTRTRLVTEAPLGDLNRWFDRALVAGALDDVFAE